tara:strand:- start:12826 stop:13650 length:825 start_codon:yes stop_codon:yes gene_type:complete
MWIGFVKALPLLAIALVVLIVTWLLTTLASRLLRNSLKRSRFRQSLIELFVTLSRVIIWSVGILVATTVIFPSLTPAKLLTALGLVSVAVGLAFKDIFENFFAGILIMLREPMRIGDFITCEGVEGRVEKIAIRETYIRQTDDQLVLVPNRFLFQNPVYVRTDKPLRRYEIIVGVAYGEDVSAAATVIRDAMDKVELNNKEKPVEVFAREFNSSSVDLTVRWWAESRPIDMHRSRDEVVRAIKRALDDAGIEIPFPYRTLTFKEPLSISRENSE